MYFYVNNIKSYTLLLLVCAIIFYPSEEAVSNGLFSPSDILMKRFSNAISISIHEDIPDLIPYQVFLQILFRLPEANAKNLEVFSQPSDNEGISHIIQGLRMNSVFHDPNLNLKMLKEFDIITDETNDDVNVLDFINQYLPDFSIRYYTCESFIFTLINNAFELSENLDDLVKLRMIVTDLYNILRFKLGGLSPSESTTTGPFYKVETISRDKLHLLKQGIGKYITFNSFLSTTTNKTRALDFINRTDDDHKKQIVILYAIEINDQNDVPQLVQPFGDITFISCTNHEPEIIFSIGQVFKIRSMSQHDTTRIWTVSLEILGKNETEHLNNLTDYYVSKIVGTETFYNGIQARVNFEPLTITTFVTVGDYYSSIIIRNFDKAEFYYEKFLQEDLQSPDDFDFQNLPAFYYRDVHYTYYLSHGHINLQLARIRYEQQKYLESSTYSQKAEDAYFKLPETVSQQTHLAQIFNNVGNIFWKYTQKYERAAPYYLHALQVDRNNAETFIHIGLTQLSAEQYWHGLHSFSTALSIIEASNKTDYLSYGLIYRGIGQIYEKTEQTTWQALSYYFKAQNIYKKSIPSNHQLRQEIQNDIKRIVEGTRQAHEDL
ncbi:unnamed protein product [Adineta steineri]|uniref:Mono(ADP-ribosyl)transferase n=1 Tax=Adineta steineri TaxID=433720 RepID=A0A813V9J3_9BILA|nr:unnamed protein product [Adineta steineri]CAF3561501.1 unnamed protein product [Adineta steineri]